MLDARYAILDTVFNFASVHFGSQPNGSLDVWQISEHRVMSLSTMPMLYTYNMISSSSDMVNSLTRRAQAAT